MYRDQAAAANVAEPKENLFTLDNGAQEYVATPGATDNDNVTPSSSPIGVPQIANNIQQIARSSSRNVKRVIVLFDDHTFESYDMK